MRSNLSKFILVVLLITIFSIQSFSVPSKASQEQSNMTTSSFKSSNLNEQKVLNQNQISKINSVTSDLRNLSISNLLNYLQTAYTYELNKFIDSTYDYLDTTLTTARAVAILKMLGLTKYVITSNETAIYDNFGAPKSNGGFAIQSSVADASVVGTYGALETIHMFNMVPIYNTIHTKAENYLHSKFYIFNNQAGFKEDYQSGIDASVQTTYYAVNALNILNYHFNQTEVNQISAFLESLWNPSNNYISNANDPDQSVILTTFEAVSTLYTLNMSSPVNSSFWNNIATGFSSYLNSQQDQSGVFTGGIHETGATANVDDTGSAISALYLLNKTTSINLDSAIQFMLQSQYSGTKFSQDVGGFSPNNSTESTSTQFSDVTLSHTYYAILGLYSSGYINNQTSFSFQTQFSRDNTVNDKKNEFLAGTNTTLSVELNSFNFKNVYDAYNIKLTVDSLTTNYENTSIVSPTSGGSQYNFEILNTTQSNYYLGAHPLTAHYALSNFSILPIYNNTFIGEVTVRLPITSQINGVSTPLTLSPGTTLNGQIYFDTATLQATGIVYDNYGNVSVSMISPDNTTVLLNNSNTFPLNINTQNYYYSYSIPNNALLGDYIFRIDYYNSSTSSFYSQQVVKVSTTMEVLGISSPINNYKIYPGSSYGLNFTLAYANGFINPNITNINAKFIESTTQQERFNVTLQYVTGNVFTANTSENVPIDLFLGSYNVSFDFTWNSVSTGSILSLEATNQTLPAITYSGTPIIENPLISPLSGRPNSNLIYSGDFINLTAKIGVKNPSTLQVFTLNNSYDMSGSLVDIKNLNNVYQDLSYKALNDSKISLYDEINPNINLLSDVNLSLIVKVKLLSTEEFNSVSTNVNNVTKEYKPELVLKQADIHLDPSSLNFIIGSSEVAQNEYTTILTTFKVLSNQNSQYVTGLKLNGTIVTPKEGSTNETETILPSITSIDTNSSYQLQIPVNNLNVGKYEIRISTLNTAVPIGNFSLTINPIVNNESIPIENFISVGAVSIAVIITLVANTINKRKK